MKKQTEQKAARKAAAMLKEISKEQMSQSIGGVLIKPGDCRTCGIFQTGGLT